MTAWGRPQIDLEIARQMLCPLGAHAGIELLACAGDDRERVSPRERPACVDHDAGVAPVGLAVIAHGVEGGAPSAADDLDVLAHIAAGAHRPDDSVYVGGINIVAHHNGPPVPLRAGLAVRSHKSGLLGVPAIELLDRNREPDPTAARVM